MAGERRWRSPCLSCRAVLTSVICFGFAAIVISMLYVSLARIGFVHPSCVPFSYAKPERYPERCTLNTCFDFSRCHRANLSDPIPVYIYPKMALANATLAEYVDPAIHIVIYDSIIYALRTLPWVRVTENAAEACLLVPHVQDLQGIDLHNFVRAPVDLAALLPYWNGGRNHLIFEFTDYETPHFDAGRAILLRSNCRRYYCREGYDLAVPIYQRFRLPEPAERALAAHAGVRPYLLSFKGTRSRDKPYRNRISSIHNGRDVLILVACHADGWLPVVDGECDEQQRRLDTHSYEELLLNSMFSLVPEGTAPHSYRLFEVMQAGSIPVIVSDDFVLPLPDLIDWRQISIHLPIAEIERLPALLRSLPAERVLWMQRAVRETWLRYFRTFELSMQWSVEMLRRRLYSAQLDGGDYEPTSADNTEPVRHYPVVIPAV